MHRKREEAWFGVLQHFFALDVLTTVTVTLLELSATWSADGAGQISELPNIPPLKRGPLTSMRVGRVSSVTRLSSALAQICFVSGLTLRT